MFTVYIIQSESTGKPYIGQTVNLEIRIKQHNDPNCDLGKYTKFNKGSWKLVYKEELQTRKEAIRRDKQLKSYRGRQFIKTKILGR